MRSEKFKLALGLGLLFCLAACKAKPKLPYGSDMEDAIRGGSTATVKVLLDAGVDPNALDEYSRTPLCDAVAKNQLDIVELILDAGAKPNLRPRGPVQCYPLAIAADRPSLDVLEALVKAGANVNENPPGDATPLLAALNVGNQAAAIYLLKHGADPNLTLPSLHSPLLYAVAHKVPPENPTVVEVMLNHGATLKPTECGKAIMVAETNFGEESAVRIARLPACKVNLPPGTEVRE